MNLTVYYICKMNIRNLQNFRIRKNAAVITVVFAVLFVATSLSVVSTTNNNNHTIQSARAQGSNATTTHDTFHAKGVIDSMASDVLAGKPVSPLNQSAMWILGGNWNYDVNKGNLQDFKVNITMVMLDGKGFHTHSIDKLSNVSGITMPSSTPTPTISLTGNNTAFKGIADINTNGKLKWKDVPVIVHIINGNVLNLTVDDKKTEDHFKGLPVFGTVTSLADENNKELRTG
jgi:hypothetical protein